MRQVIKLLFLGLTLLVTTTALAEGERYKAIPLSIKDGNSGVFIVDTKEGHLWMWMWETEWSHLIYQGQVRPGEKPGDVISSGNIDKALKKALSGDYAYLMKQTKWAEKEGRLLDAINLVRKARKIRIDESNSQYLATLLNNFGFAHAEQKNYKKAISFYEESLMLDPHPKTYLNMAISDDSLGNEKKAMKSLEKAYALKPMAVKTQRDILVFWARLSESGKSYKKAIDLYEKSIEVYPEDRETLTALGMLYFNKIDYDKALKYLNKATTLSPEKQDSRNAEIYKLIGEIYRKKGRIKNSNENKSDQ